MLHPEANSSPDFSSQTDMNYAEGTPARTPLLYREGLITQADAAKLGPDKPTPEQSQKVEEALLLKCPVKRVGRI
jgi:hypothetical protein